MMLPTLPTAYLRYSGSNEDIVEVLHSFNGVGRVS